MYSFNNFSLYTRRPSSK